MVARRFSNLSYEYKPINWSKIRTPHLGIYIHVPFCERLCAFCPFHRILYDAGLKNAYVKALLDEIKLRKLKGDVEWVYFGGGTPNLLPVEEIEQIIHLLKESVSTEDIAIEGKPTYFTDKFLDKIQRLEISKISMGVESLKDKVLQNVQRDRTDVPLIRSIVNKAHSLNMVVNADLMVGLPQQYRGDFLFDITRLADLGLDQITTYPFTKAPGARAKPGVSSRDIFEMIESAAEILEGMGYVRENVWVFSTPELAKKAPGEHPSEYVGLGPSAFSKVETVQIVNPALEEYITRINQGATYGFWLEFDEAFDAWRQFAHRLYDLKVEKEFTKTLPRNIRLVIFLLK